MVAAMSSLSARLLLLLPLAAAQQQYLGKYPQQYPRLYSYSIFGERLLQYNPETAAFNLFKQELLNPQCDQWRRPAVLSGRWASQFVRFLPLPKDLLLEYDVTGQYKVSQCYSDNLNWMEKDGQLPCMELSKGQWESEGSLFFNAGEATILEYNYVSSRFRLYKFDVDVGFGNADLGSINPLKSALTPLTSGIWNYLPKGIRDFVHIPIQDGSGILMEYTPLTGILRMWSVDSLVYQSEARPHPLYEAFLETDFQFLALGDGKILKMDGSHDEGDYEVFAYNRSSLGQAIETGSSPFTVINKGKLAKDICAPLDFGGCMNSSWCGWCHDSSKCMRGDDNAPHLQCYNSYSKFASNKKSVATADCLPKPCEKYQYYWHVIEKWIEIPVYYGTPRSPALRIRNKTDPPVIVPTPTPPPPPVPEPPPAVPYVWPSVPPRDPTRVDLLPDFEDSHQGIFGMHNKDTRGTYMQRTEAMLQPQPRLYYPPQFYEPNAKKGIVPAEPFPQGDPVEEPAALHMRPDDKPVIKKRCKKWNATFYEGFPPMDEKPESLGPCAEEGTDVQWSVKIIDTIIQANSTFHGPGTPAVPDTPMLESEVLAKTNPAFNNKKSDAAGQPSVSSVMGLSIVPSSNVLKPHLHLPKSFSSPGGKVDDHPVKCAPKPNTESMPLKPPPTQLSSEFEKGN